jgi:hypothetical protein
MIGIAAVTTGPEWLSLLVPVLTFLLPAYPRDSLVSTLIDSYYAKGMNEGDARAAAELMAKKDNVLVDAVLGELFGAGADLDLDECASLLEGVIMLVSFGVAGSVPLLAYSALPSWVEGMTEVSEPGRLLRFLLFQDRGGQMVVPDALLLSGKHVCLGSWADGSLPLCCRRSEEPLQCSGLVLEWPGSACIGHAVRWNCARSWRYGFRLRIRLVKNCTAAALTRKRIETQ